MVAVTLIEALAETLCGVAAVLFTFIATLARSPSAERVAQHVISVVLVLAAAVLWWLSLAVSALRSSDLPVSGYSHLHSSGGEDL